MALYWCRQRVSGSDGKYKCNEDNLFPLLYIVNIYVVATKMRVQKETIKVFF